MKSPEAESLDSEDISNNRWRQTQELLQLRSALRSALREALETIKKSVCPPNCYHEEGYFCRCGRVEMIKKLGEMEC